MNALKPRKAFIQDQLNTQRLTPIQWDGIMRAMKNYAEHYHETMQANEFEKLQEQCTLPFVIKSLPLTGKRLEILEKTYNRLLSEEPTKL